MMKLAKTILPFLALMSMRIGVVLASNCPCFDRADLEAEGVGVESFNNANPWAMRFTNGRLFRTNTGIRTSISLRGPPPTRVYGCKVVLERPCSLGWCALNTPPDFGVEISRGISKSEHEACIAELQSFDLFTPPNLEEFDSTYSDSAVTLRNGATGEFLAIRTADNGQHVIGFQSTSELERPTANQFVVEEVNCASGFDIDAGRNSERACFTLMSVAFPDVYVNTNGANAIAAPTTDFLLSRFQLNSPECRVSNGVCTVQLLVSFYGDRAVGRVAAPNTVPLVVDLNSPEGRLEINVIN